MSSDAKAWTDSPVELWRDVSRELWEVQLLGGATRLMTGDEILAALSRREMDGETVLRRHGGSTWMTLREANAGGPIGVPVPSAAPTPEPAPKVSAAALVPKSPSLPPPQKVVPAPAATVDIDPTGTEELAVLKPSSVVGKVIAVASVALVGGALFTAMSAKLSSPNDGPGATNVSAAPQPPRAALSVLPKANAIAAALPAPSASNTSRPTSPAAAATPAVGTTTTATAPPTAPQAAGASIGTTSEPGTVATKTPSTAARARAHHAPTVAQARAAPRAHSALGASAKKSAGRPEKKAKPSESAKAPAKAGDGSSSTHKPRAAYHAPTTGRTASPSKERGHRAEVSRPAT